MIRRIVISFLKLIGGILAVLVLLVCWVSLPPLGGRAHLSSAFPERAFGVCALDLKETGISELVDAYRLSLIEGKRDNGLESILIKKVIPIFLPHAAGVILISDNASLEPVFFCWLDNHRLSRLVWLGQLPLNYMLRQKGVFCGAYKNIAYLTNQKNALRPIARGGKAPGAKNKVGRPKRFLQADFVNTGSALSIFFEFLEDKIGYCILTSSDYIEKLKISLGLSGLDCLSGEIRFYYTAAPDAETRVREDATFLRQILERFSGGSKLDFSWLEEAPGGRNLTFSFHICGLSPIIKETLR